MIGSFALGVIISSNISCTDLLLPVSSMYSFARSTKFRKVGFLFARSSIFEYSSSFHCLIVLFSTDLILFIAENKSSGYPDVFSHFISFCNDSSRSLFCLFSKSLYSASFLLHFIISPTRIGHVLSDLLY